MSATKLPLWRLLSLEFTVAVAVAVAVVVAVAAGVINLKVYAVSDQVMVDIGVP